MIEGIVHNNGRCWQLNRGLLAQKWTAKAGVVSPHDRKGFLAFVGKLFIDIEDGSVFSKPERLFYIEWGPVGADPEPDGHFFRTIFDDLELPGNQGHLSVNAKLGIGIRCRSASAWQNLLPTALIMIEESPIGAG